MRYYYDVVLKIWKFLPPGVGANYRDHGRRKIMLFESIFHSFICDQDTNLSLTPSEDRGMLKIR